MVIGSPEIIEQNDEIEYRVSVESANNTQSLYFLLAGKYRDFIATYCDAPLVTLLIPAMAQGEDIFVRGTVSEKLLHNLSGPYQRLLQFIMPQLRLVKIYPDDTGILHSSSTNVATAFSGGIDASCVLADYYYKNIPESMKITHLFFHNLGSHNWFDDNQTLFQKRLERIESVTRRIGLPLISVSSNMGVFFKGFSYEQTHTIRNASVALLLQKGIRRFYYASGFHYPEVYVGKSLYMGHSDLIGLPLVATEAIDTLSVGSEYSRVEKTVIVAGIKESYEWLDVCNHLHNGRFINCSLCGKCMRTLLTLDITGHIEKYSKVFDLDLYRKNKTLLIARALASRNEFCRQITAYASNTGYSFPLVSYLLFPVFYVLYSFKFIFFPIAKIILRPFPELRRRFWIY